MDGLIHTCTFCGHIINTNISGEPFLLFKHSAVCYNCYIDLIPEIYNRAGYGDGGFIHLVFTEVLKSTHNRKNRRAISNYKSILKKLLSKYNFKCVNCSTKENLTIDHIKPVSKGGTDDFNNLQILCKSCNSKKGAKYNG